MYAIFDKNSVPSWIGSSEQALIRDLAYAVDRRSVRTSENSCAYTLYRVRVGDALIIRYMYVSTTDLWGSPTVLYRSVATGVNSKCTGNIRCARERIMHT